MNLQFSFQKRVADFLSQATGKKNLSTDLCCCHSKQFRGFFSTCYATDSMTRRLGFVLRSLQAGRAVKSPSTTTGPGKRALTQPDQANFQSGQRFLLQKGWQVESFTFYHLLSASCSHHPDKFLAYGKDFHVHKVKVHLSLSLNTQESLNSVNNSITNH